MTVDPKGYLRPRQHGELTPDEEAGFAAVCPGLGIGASVTAGRDHVLWGPMVEVRSGHAADAGLRHTASSGGALSALLVHLLETGQVDFVLQTTASQDTPFANAPLFASDATGILGAAGSRYAPSAPLAALPEALARPGRGAFVGKPCDVAALHALAARDTAVRDKFPYLLSFFCAGVPSLRGAREILTVLGVDEADLASFRYRGNGWPGHAAATRQDGTSARMSYADSWGSILSRHVQFRCKICPDGTGGLADVVCADAWHCDERGYPLFEERDGISLIVTRTERGENLVRAALEAGVLMAESTDPTAIAPMQPGQLRRKLLVFSRLAAMAILFRARPRFRGFNLRAAARRAGGLANLKSFLGMCRRLVLPGRAP